MSRPPGASTWLSLATLITCFTCAPVAIADLDGPWREIPIPARAGHCAIYDPVSDRVWMFGGADASTLTNELWTFSPFLKRWTLQFLGSASPSPRVGHTGIYDPVRQRMIVFGGNTGVRSNEVWALALSGGGGWTQLAPSGAAPSPREAHAAIYDPVGDRMIVFGGMDDGGVLNDLWSLSLAGTPQWQPLAPSGSPPSARSGASAVYDSQRQRMIVFGGRPASGLGNDTWALDLGASPSWSSIATAGTPPSERMFHSALYDAPRDRMLVFSGENFPNNLVRIDCYQLNLSGTPTWQLFGIANSSRGALVYDSANDRALLYGGYVDMPPWTTNQTWIIPLNGGNSSRLAPTGAAPYGRADESAVYDVNRHRVVVFGGENLGGFEAGFSNQTSVLSIPWSVGPNPPPDLRFDWIPFGTGTPPSERFGHTAIVDAPGDRMILFAGEDPYGTPAIKNDVWTLSLATGAWSSMTPSGTPPQARTQHTAIFDPVGRRMIVFGGHTVGRPFPPPWAPLNDVWQLALDVSPPLWSPLVPLGAPPPARSKHTAILDLAQSRMIVFGGRDASGALLNDVWALSLTGTPTWSQLAPMGTPPSPREEHSAIYTVTPTPRMIVYGGNANREVWNLSLEGPQTWTLETVGGQAPEISARHAAVFNGDNGPNRTSVSMIVIGGNSAGLRELQLPAATAVEDLPALEHLGLAAWPNPAAGEIQVAFNLPDPGPASIALFDLNGRRVAHQELGVLGPGAHVVPLREVARLNAGLYWLCLERGSRRAATKIAIMR